MNPVQSVAGVVAGAVGAAIWAAIAYFAHVEVGYVALGVGALVGLAVAATGRKGVVAGVGAVLITVVALLAGKFACVEMLLHNQLAELPTTVDRVDDERATVWIAASIVEQREEAGIEVNWQRGMNFDKASEPAHYPSDVWQEAVDSWSAMSVEEQVAFKQQRVDAFNAYLQPEIDKARKEEFLATFSPFDLLFFGLAIVTAWGIAKGADSSTEEVSEESAPAEPVEMA